VKTILWRIAASFRRVAVGILGTPRRIHLFFTETPDDTPLVETIGTTFQSQNGIKEFLFSIGEHISALRLHLLRSLLVLILTTGFSLIFAKQLMGLLALPLAGEKIFTIPLAPVPTMIRQLVDMGQTELAKLQVIEPTEAIGVFMRVALLAGVSLAMPWLVMEVYLFIAPGLMPRTRVLLLAAIPIASLLFLLGLLSTFFLMLPTAIPFLYNFMGFRAAWRPTQYFDLVTNLMFWIGLFFEMPLLVYVLAAAGLVTAGMLAKHWRFAIIAIAILASVITPTVDPVNMMLAMAPMVLVYFLSILAAAIPAAGRPIRKTAGGV
jgi:sec-independent protein translocase protein TatC